jgi:hypothetical protein
MKTDCDTILTPAFLRWFPSVFTAGRGGYGGKLQNLIFNYYYVVCRYNIFHFLTHCEYLQFSFLRNIPQQNKAMSFTRHKVFEWANKFGVNHRGLFNVGATWFGRPRKVLDAAALAANFTTRLLNEAFPPDGLNEWPRWYVGVSSMYGQVINNRKAGSPKEYLATETRQWLSMLLLRKQDQLPLLIGQQAKPDQFSMLFIYIVFNIQHSSTNTKITEDSIMKSILLVWIQQMLGMSCVFICL